MAVRSQVARSALALGLIAAVAAGCGGGDSASTSSASDSTSTHEADTTAASGAAAALRDRFAKALLRVLTDREGLSEAQAKCALDRFQHTVDDADLAAAVRAAQNGERPPQSVLDAAFDAGAKCKRQGAG